MMWKTNVAEANTSDAFTVLNTRKRIFKTAFKTAFYTFIFHLAYIFRNMLQLFIQISCTK